MKHFELVKEYAYPSGSVYVLYNKEKDFYIETTSIHREPSLQMRGQKPIELSGF